MSEPNIHEVIAVHGVNLKINIDKDSTPADTMRAIDTVCAQFNVVEGSAELLRHTLGKLLAYVKQRNLFEEEFKNFEGFKEEIGRRHHLSRATLNDALMKATRLPKLTAEQVERIPITNLTLVARAAKKATPSKVRRYLKQAEFMSQEDLRQKLEGDLDRRQPQREDRVTIRIMASKRVASQWEKLVGDGDANDLFAELVQAASATRKAKATAA